MVKGRGLGKGLGALVKTQEKPQGTLKIAIQTIQPNPYQPRVTFDKEALAALTASIRQHGLVQPIVVRKTEDGYELVAGERRWRACQALGWTEIDAIVKDYSTEETTEIALVENLQRQDLDPIEEGHAYKRLMNTFKLTQEDMAGKLGRSRSHIANMMRLLKLPARIQNALSAGEVTIGQVRPLLTIRSAQMQEEIFEEILAKGLNARQVEALVKRRQQGTKTPKDTTSSQESAELRAWADRLKVSLGTPVAIKMGAGKKVAGKIEIKFGSEMELVRLLAFLEEGQGQVPGEKREDPPFTV